LPPQIGAHHTTYFRFAASTLDGSTQNIKLYVGHYLWQDEHTPMLGFN
jgi:hypothetical protein